MATAEQQARWREKRRRRDLVDNYRWTMALHSEAYGDAPILEQLNLAQIHAARFAEAEAAIGTPGEYTVAEFSTALLEATRDARKGPQ